MPPWARGWVGASGSPPRPCLTKEHHLFLSLMSPESLSRCFSSGHSVAGLFSSPFPFPPPRSPHAGTHLPGTPSQGARCSFFQAFNYCCKLKRRELREGGGRLLGGARPGDGGAGCTARGTQGIRALSEAWGRWKCAVSFYPGVHPTRGPTVGIVPRPCPPRLLSRGERGTRGSPGEQIC